MIIAGAELRSVSSSERENPILGRLSESRLLSAQANSNFEVCSEYGRKAAQYWCNANGMRVYMEKKHADGRFLVFAKTTDEWIKEHQGRRNVSVSDTAIFVETEESVVEKRSIKAIEWLKFKWKILDKDTRWICLFYPRP